MSKPHPLESANTRHLDHLLADPHQCVVQLWIHHLCLLQLEHLLVAPGTQLLLDFFQAFYDLQHNYNQVRLAVGMIPPSAAPIHLCAPLLAHHLHPSAQVRLWCLDFINKSLPLLISTTCFKLIFSHKQM